MKRICRPLSLVIDLFGWMGGILFGYNLGVIAGALLFLQQEFQLNAFMSGFLTSIAIVGALLGAKASGFIADSFGRRRLLIYNSLIYVVGILIASFATDLILLLCGRFVTGIAIGVTSVIVPIYLSELSPPRIRGGSVSGYQFSITIGIFFSYLISYFFSQTGNWSVMFLFGAPLAAIQGIGLLFLPESPYILIAQNKDDQARKILSKISLTENVEEIIDQIKSVVLSEKCNRYKLLFSTRYRKIFVIGVVLGIFQMACGINAVILYAPQIFTYAGFALPSEAIYQTLSIGIVNMLFSVVAICLLDVVGRRILLLAGMIGMTVSLSVLAWTFFSDYEWLKPFTIYSLKAYVAFFAFSIGPGTWVVISEIFPARLRAVAISFVLLGCWTVNYAVVLTFLDLVSAIGMAGAFTLYAAICFLGIFFIAFFIPETKGKSLEEIEKSL